jgi:hypothetical protein
VFERQVELLRKSAMTAEWSFVVGCSEGSLVFWVLHQRC